jgi:D-alanine transaminase
MIVKGGSIITTPLSKHILSGITRMAVKNMAEQLQIPDEIFVTSTTLEITPIIRVDNIQIKEGTPGSVTKALQERFKQIL